MRYSDRSRNARRCAKHQRESNRLERKKEMDEAIHRFVETFEGAREVIAGRHGLLLVATVEAVKRPSCPRETRRAGMAMSSIFIILEQRFQPAV
jgi:hypothetical protein